MPTLVEAAELIRTRKLSPLELTAQCLHAIHERNPQLNAFITVTTELANEQAARAEEEIAAGKWRGPLHGIPLALKDNIDVAGVPTTAASNQFRGRIAQQDAEIVTLLKQAGAVILGKTNLHEFAFGGSGLISAFGPVRNPRAPDRITGGSSSGSAAAVAAGMCIAAIGTDTAGSVRCPAALCGLVGHRPSQGWFSNVGTVPLSPTMDTCGPIAQTVEDAALMLSALAPTGYPPGLRFPKVLDSNIKGLRLAVPRNLAAGCKAAVARRFENAIETVAAQGATLSDIDLQWDSPMLIRVYEISRYHATMMAHTPELYQAATRERIAAGQGVREEEYLAAVRAFRDHTRDLRVFETWDAVLSPTVPVTAPRIDDLAALEPHSLREYEVQHLLRNTIPFSTLWWPSLSVPCGSSDEGLPVGLQVSAAPGDDATALRVARAYERGTR